MFVTNITTFVLLLLLLIFIKWLWNRRFMYLLSLKMPGPIGLPFIGSEISYHLEPQGNLAFLEKLSKRYESNFCFWLGPKLYVELTKWEDIEIVLTSYDCMYRDDLSKNMLHDMIIGEGMFTSEGLKNIIINILNFNICLGLCKKGERWKRSRRIIAPSFNYGIIVNYIPIFDEQSMDCVRDLKKHAGKAAFNIRPIIEQATYFAFFKSILACDISPETMWKYGENVLERQILTGIRYFNPWYAHDFIWNLSKHGRRARKLKEDSIQMRDDIWPRIHAKSSNATLLQRLYRISNDNDNFTEEEMKAEVTTVFAAATESTSGPITIALVLLAMHQNVQDKVFEELKRILPNKNSAIMKEDLEKMYYLEMCIQEQLRLYPSVPISIRKNSRALRLQNYDIPVGTSILINFHQLHRNPIYWGPNANEFDPNHFSPENVTKLTESTYLPFGAGPKKCIGKTYAMIAIKTFLANILRNYKITTHLKLKDLSISSVITIMINNSVLMVQLEDRNV